MSKLPTITVFGAANVDITGIPYEKLVYKDANMGDMIISAGGVGRNIAENLVRLGFKLDLISVFGDDPLSEFLINDCKSKQINIDHSLYKNNATASTFLAILNTQKDLALGLSAMKLYDNLSKDEFDKILHGKLNSVYTVLDTNFPEAILEHIVNKYPGQKFVLDTVSGKKSYRAENILKHLYILKANLFEAEMLSSQPLISFNRKTLYRLADYFLEQGVKKVFITLGGRGALYACGDNKKIISPVQAKIVNTTGAGDAFVSGLIYADFLNKNCREMTKYAMSAAALTVSYPEAVFPDLNVQSLEEKFKHA